MNSNLLWHDLRNGIVRKRYLLIPVFFLLPCFNCLQTANGMMEHGTWLDYYLSCFIGEMPQILDGFMHDGLVIPYRWLFAVTGGLILNLDYMISDLETEGIQFILQTKKRSSWFISKGIWNLISSLLYFLGAGLTALIFTVLSGGAISLSRLTGVGRMLFQGLLMEKDTEVLWKLYLCGIGIPFFSFCICNLLQMTLCLYTKPAVSLILLLGLTVFSIYIPYPWIIGNGMMGIRNMLFVESGQFWLSVICPAAIGVVCWIIGVKRFKRMDLLGQEVL